MCIRDSFQDGAVLTADFYRIKRLIVEEIPTIFRRAVIDSVDASVDPERLIAVDARNASVSYTHLDVYKRQETNFLVTIAIIVKHLVNDITPSRSVDQE